MSIATTQASLPAGKSASALAAARRRRTRLRNAVLPVLSALVGIVIWEITVRWFAIPGYLLPAPTAVLSAMVDRWSYLMTNLGYTALAALSGFFIALVLGVTLGIAIAASPIVDRIVYPWLVISHAVPKVVVAPLMLVWIGFGLKSGWSSPTIRTGRRSGRAWPRTRRPEASP